MSLDWKKLVKAVAPTLGTALGGPLAGAAIKVLGDQILGNQDAKEDDVAAAVMQGLPPEAIVALKQADQAFAVRMRELEIDVNRLNADTEKAYLADVVDARDAHHGDLGVFRLGLAIILTFGVVMAAVLWGSFELMTGGIKVKDVAVVATATGLIGTVVGYVAANAQQVVSYFFGSSRGSKDKTDALAQAVRGVGQK